MAEAAGYPKVPAKAWRVLRTRAATAPSTKFTPSTVAALLTMGSAASAQSNVVSPLQRLGLFDESGTLTARGNKISGASTRATRTRARRSSRMSTRTTSRH